MSDETTLPPPGTPLFAKPPAERSGIPPVAILAALAAVLIALAVIVLSTRGRHNVHPGNILPLDPYAQSLPITEPAMSESTSLSGGKSTYIDGHIRNTGSKTVTAITVQAIFRNDEAMPPQVETQPLSLIRTHQPYVDTESVSAAPLAPGDDREFRLTFEAISPNWNVQIPEIHITSVTTK
jgi:hypothetical protein